MPLRCEKIKLCLCVTNGDPGKSLALFDKALENHAYNDYEFCIVDVDEERVLATTSGVKTTPAIHGCTTSGVLIYTSDLADAIRESLVLKGLDSSTAFQNQRPTLAK